MRRSLLIGFVALPALALAAYGCGDDPPIEDYCGWLKDPNSCWRSFANDIEQPLKANDSVRCANLSHNPSLSANFQKGVGQLGAFLNRGMLDNCFIQTGGIIQFDKPLDLSMPGVVGFTMINGDSTVCGTASVTSAYDFKIAVNGDTMGQPTVSGGSFSFVPTTMRSTATATCGPPPIGPNPNAAPVTHYFNTLQILKCPELTDTQPKAELDVFSGGFKEDGTLDATPSDGLGIFGAVQFKLFLPPTATANATKEVDFFTCLIPPPPSQCSNGIQDGSESDVDCGGTMGCPRCMEGRKCIFNSDCASNVCTTMMGLRICAAGGTSSSSSTSSSSASTGTGG